MKALDLECELSDNEHTARATVELQSPIRNGITDHFIQKVRLRNSGPDHVVLIEPAHVASLEPLACLEVQDKDTLETRIHDAYGRRLLWLQRMQALLAELGLEPELSEPGFCALARVTTPAGTVVVSARDEATLVIEALDGESLATRMDPAACIVDISMVRSQKQLLARLEEQLALAQDRPRKPDTEPIPDDPFQALDKLLGKDEETTSRLWLVPGTEL
jgi:hypothetical protein